MDSLVLLPPSPGIGFTRRAKVGEQFAEPGSPPGSRRAGSPTDEPESSVNDVDLAYLSAYDAGKLIEGRQLSPVELTGALLDRIDDLNPKLNAFLAVTRERALADARAAEERSRRGERLSAIDGVPHSIKDDVKTEGIRTTDGSLWGRDSVPDTDALLAARMRAAGSPLLGKTNLPQAGYKDMTDNLLGPAATNPWNLSRTPGGSSGGAAAAVAAGLGALASGGDGAGSIRIPAAFTGTVGFKPSHGRVPTWPSGNWFASLSSKGPITRSVLDSALMLNVIAGPDPRDPLCIDSPVPDFVDATKQNLDGLRVAWSPDLGHASVESDVADACARAALSFEELGCEVAELPVTWGRLAREIIEPTWTVHLASYFAGRADERPDWIEPSLMEMVRRGRALSGVDYRQLLERRADLYDRVHSVFEKFDLLLTPTMPGTAWPLSREPSTPLFDRLPFTYPFNLTGHPAVSVPCGLDRNGLPIGLQIVAGWHRDDLAFTAAARYEEASPWAMVPTGI